MSKHPLALFYGKNRKLSEKEMKTYKSLPLILFISREPNDVFNELEGIGTYNYGEKNSPNTEWPLKCIAHILDKTPEELKKTIQKKGDSPIILSYRYPCSIPNSDSLLKAIIRKISDHTKHSSNIANLLKDYQIGLVIDHSGVDSSIEDPLMTGKLKSIFLDTYFGKQGISKEKASSEIDRKLNGAHKTIIRNIWEEFLSRTGR